MEKAQEWFDYGIELSKEFGHKLLTALIIYIVGMWVVKKIIKGTRKVMSKSKYDESLQKFLLNLFSWALKIFLIIIVISRLGVDVTTFAAVIAAAGLAQNFAALRSLTTTGIQKGHMKMHLLNILNQLQANPNEKEQLISYFKTHSVSHRAVVKALENLRK